jgi:NADH-quinone oxidoreductase subunit H
MVPGAVIPLLEALLFPGVLFLVALALFSEWVDRKVVARLQNRVGPHHAGPAGILQPLADFIKLLAKEDIVPAAADRLLFTSIPLVMLSLALTPLFMIPIAAPSALTWFEGDLIFIMFLLSLLALTTFLGAWASTNRLSALGGVRAALQMLGYEIPLTLAMIGPAIAAKSLSVSRIVQAQAGGPWYVVTQPLGFVVVVVSFLAELHLIPFDLPEAETELVAGWLVEFSGKKLALLRLAKDLEAVLAASLMTALYLGGPAGLWGVPPALAFLLKVIPCTVLLSNLRALFARLRIDQALRGAWKYLTPLAFLQVAVVEATPLVIP